MQKISIPTFERKEEQRPAKILLAGAEQALEEGRFSQAEMLLERALRVEPRNARLWHGMGQVKYEKKNYAQTVQFCLKSDSLAGNDYSLTQQNWLLIEKAYIKMGKTEKAEQARRKALY